MIWYSTNYFNSDSVTATGVTEKAYKNQTNFQAFAVILGVTHVIGESDDKDDLQAWLDKWEADGKKAAEADRPVKEAAVEAAKAERKKKNVV